MHIYTCSYCFDSWLDYDKQDKAELCSKCYENSYGVKLNQIPVSGNYIVGSLELTKDECDKLVIMLRSDLSDIAQSILNKVNRL